MSFSGSSEGPTREELAWELAELFDDLSLDHVNEVLAKNVPIETLKFFASYAEDFSDVHGLDTKPRRRLANLMVLGYLLRVVEDRVLDPEE
jgi:hypothetical protein